VTEPDLTPTEAARLMLLDRLAARCPSLDLDSQAIEWMTLDDGHEALVVNGCGVDGGSGAFFATPERTCMRSARCHRSHRWSAAS
jgi:hypothetical protein